MQPEDIKLNTGYTIPQIGLGLWKVTEPDEFKAMFAAATDAGYTHFDSAQIYHNEQLLGDAIAEHQLNREKLFITTKIDVRNFTQKRLVASFDESLIKLRSEYVDLLLLHFPVTLLRDNAWKTLQSLHASGQARSIGVSNYTIKHLEALVDHARIVPAVNQVELHVFLQQPELLEYCRSKGIVVEAYSPLAHGKANDEPAIQNIADKHDRSYAQIMLRWCLQSGLVALPKSRTPARLAENFAVTQFTLDDEDMAALKGLDRNLRTCWSPVHVP